MSYRILSLALLACTSVAFAQTAPDAAEFFEKKVRPILAARCQTCHNSKMKMSGLDMSSAAAFAEGGPSGELVGEIAEHSLLLQAVTYETKLKMPPTGKLPDEEIEVLRAWVKLGAPWPDASATPGTKPAPAAKYKKGITDEDRKFWAFQPVRRPALPAVRNNAWVQSPIDQFILAKLEERGIFPAPKADKLSLLRRVTYDLTGLPPTPEEISNFLSDNSADAYKKVVERLLASPRYGERWGRHWLDVARYADSTGNDEDHRYPYAWRYRDYVIKAFNDDKPYDQFVREQLAGDLLPAPDGSPVNREGVIATGFLALGAKAIAQADKQKMLYDIYDEQVDVTSKAFLGLTMACARCHDHKFDPILTKDYYSLAGIFASTKNLGKVPGIPSQLLFTPLVPRAEYDAWVDSKKPMQYKRTQAAIIEELEALRIQREWLKTLASQMVAAHTQPETKDARLENLAKYLKKTPEVRDHLNDWFASPTLETAQKYQSRVEESLAKYQSALTQYQQDYLAATATADPQAKLPKKPELDKDPFLRQILAGPFRIDDKQKASLFSADVQTRAKALRDEAKQLEAKLAPEPDMACAVQEGEPVQQTVFVRGDYNAKGEPAPPAFPTVLAPDSQFQPKGSGRLEWANWITRPDHPLTSRVMANRIWLGHFGEGIVRTPDNFGKMGERPTHPELLDFLASEFVAKGWSIKALHRMILMSSTYQMSTDTSDKSFELDPENKLFSRFQRRRLAIEEIRDGMLAIDGSLDLTMGGTLQSGFGTDGENSEGRLSLKPETLKRRMVYVPLRRANLPTMLNLFDFGDATTMTGKRTLTNVAPQALFMMNSEFVNERARAIARTAEGNIDSVYLRVLNRKPTKAELDQAKQFVSTYRTQYASPLAPPESAMAALARVLLASNEFIYLD